MKRFGGAAAMAAGMLVLTACGVVPDAASVVSEDEEFSSTWMLEDAAEYCEVPDDVLQDAGQSMSFDTMGEDEHIGDSYEDIACVMTYLDAPDYVIDHIDNTRALDGQQSDEWDDIEARWSYHPDSGMNLTLIDRS